jgi:hypothetical protein
MARGLNECGDGTSIFNDVASKGWETEAHPLAGEDGNSATRASALA